MYFLCTKSTFFYKASSFRINNIILWALLSITYHWFHFIHEWHFEICIFRKHAFLSLINFVVMHLNLLAFQNILLSILIWKVMAGVHRSFHDRSRRIYTMGRPRELLNTKLWSGYSVYALLDFLGYFHIIVSISASQFSLVLA